MKYLEPGKPCWLSIAMMITSLSLGVAGSVGLAELILAVSEYLKGH